MQTFVVMFRPATALGVDGNTANDQAAAQLNRFAQPPRWAWIETAWWFMPGKTTKFRPATALGVDGNSKKSTSKPRRPVSPSHRAGRGLKLAPVRTQPGNAAFRPATALGVDGNAAVIFMAAVGIGFAQPPRWAWIETKNQLYQLLSETFRPATALGVDGNLLPVVANAAAPVFRPATALGVDGNTCSFLV